MGDFSYSLYLKGPRAPYPGPQMGTGGPPPPPMGMRPGGPGVPPHGYPGKFII